MTSTITTARKALAAALKTAGLQVSHVVPERITPPAVVMGSADPYIETNETFDLTEHQVNVELFVIAASRRNASEVEQLDELAEHVLTADPGPWVLGDVGPHFVATIGQAEYLVLKIPASTLLTIERT